MTEEEIKKNEELWNQEQLEKGNLKTDKIGTDSILVVTTTPNIEGHPIKEYKDIVFGEVVQGTDVLSGMAAGLADMFGSRSNSYESYLMKARAEAIDEMKQRAIKRGANAIVGVKVDCEVTGESHMMQVTASGTAVVIE